MLALGIDSGTSGTKTIVLDLDAGTVLTEARHPHRTIEGLPHGHVEQDPRTWIEAAAATIHECLAKIGERRKEICAVGVSGQQHGLVVLNEAGAPIRPAKLWCDTSTAAEAEELNVAFGGADGLIERTGNAMTPGFTAPKLLWLKRHEPENFRRTRTVLLPHDYVNFWLSGRAQMECGDASGTGLMDVRTRTWFAPLVDYIDPDLRGMLPLLGSSQHSLGLLAPERQRDWDLSGDVRVGAGGGDNMMGAIGTGNVRAGVVTVSLGTSGTIYACGDQPVIDPHGEIAAFCDSTGRWLPLACTMNVAVAIDQVRQLFGWDIPTLEANVASVPAGCDGLMFLPFLRGERMPNLPHGTGVFHGLTSRTMSPAFMARAVVEGVMLGLAYALRRVERLGVVPEEIRMTGGGSKSAEWRQIAADVFGCAIVNLEIAEGAALGAAIQAAWNAEACPSIDSLQILVDRLVKIDRGSCAQAHAPQRVFYADLLQRHTALTQNLHSSGYL